MCKEGDKIFLEKASGEAKVVLNGQPVLEKTQVHHNDRLMFGTTQMFVFCDPKERDGSKQKYEEVTFESFQQEVARGSGAISQKSSEEKDPGKYGFYIYRPYWQLRGKRI